ncbi:MAG: ATP-dependent Clp protease ATP-binding subunit [Nitrospirae bacterium]|nr:ATP-dependent Clp protease ATP-binding subunit [Nitrospirota bacterium]
MNNDILPRWAREIERFLSVKSQFVLWGNVYDVYPMESGQGVITLRLIDFLKTLLKRSNFNIVVNYEPINGFKLIEGDPAGFNSFTEYSLDKDKSLKCTLGKAFEVIERLVASRQEYSAVILNMASRLGELSGNDVQEFYYRLFSLSHGAAAVMNNKSPFPQFNAIFWILDKENDLPAWYTLENARLKVISIPKPDYQLRKIVVENLSRKIHGFNALDDKKRDEGMSLFIDETNGLHASEIISIVSMAMRDEVSFSNISDAIRMYKLGIIENPWAKLDVTKIANAEEILSRRVKGQDHAVRNAADILKRAVYNLAGAQYSKFSQRPKGVLFLAGPTGVGKTELAKALAELIFGSETGYVRFDMSEYAQEHSDQRLIGSPPGYVGYDVGGQLTNAIKQNPFAVILFDEIEKAHSKILDVFLQILDDGRLTSGRGETVYFSESLIVFTSNLGLYEVAPGGEKIQRVTQEMVFEEINEKILQAIGDFFKYRIGRPEILNRIGDNIVVFDFIRPDTASRILAKMLGNVKEKLLDTYGITLELTEEGEKVLSGICCTDLSMGGRGIANKLEAALVNPLSRTLFSSGAKSGDKLVLTDIVKENQTWKLVTQKQ